jgi:hypothetical protein
LVVVVLEQIVVVETEIMVATLHLQILAEHQSLQ